ncbi:MAG: putative Glycosyl transferase, family 2 [Nitrospira sp.]|jgi:glycosyltransferase involved in cell wall biosynthesis|nr:putative Glycosyl transferase, family 2 [Nitrospira sp.]
MKDALVSVVIPVFNGAPFVAKAVASVRAQGHKTLEILVVDDGSTDGTQEVLKRLEQSDGIRWFQRSHGGPARSRNYGIEAAQGRFIALLDCDDEWLPGKLAAQLTIMDHRPEVGLVHTDFEVRFEDGTLEERVAARSSREPMVQAFAGGHVALPSTLLIRKTILDQVGRLDPELYGSEDSDLTIRLFRVTAFECIDQVLVRKLQRGHGYRDMAFDEQTHRERVLASRDRFLMRLEGFAPLTAAQRAALDREWANYFLLKGVAAERAGRRSEARRQYLQAIRKAPGRVRGYTRWLRTLKP